MIWLYRLRHQLKMLFKRLKYGSHVISLSEANRCSRCGGKLTYHPNIVRSLVHNDKARKKPGKLTCERCKYNEPFIIIGEEKF